MNDEFVIENGVLIKYNGNGGDVVIPDSVTAIEREAFAGMGITSVTIPDSVTSIGWSAFGNCRNLTSVVIPGSVTKIGGFAFAECHGLTSVIIGDGVTCIGGDAFIGCGNLTDVTVPDSVTSIGKDAFSTTAWVQNFPDGTVGIAGKVLIEYQGNDKTVIIPDGVTQIVGGFFPKTGTVMLPDSIRYIESDCFRAYVDFKNGHCDNCDIVLYGVTISFRNLYSECCEKFDGGLNGDKKVWDKQRWRNYSEIEADIVEGIIDRLNLILNRKFDELEQYAYIHDECYKVIVAMFRAYPDDEEILAYIGRNMIKLCPYLTGDENLDTIDGCIRCLIDKQEYEIILRLLSYLLKDSSPETVQKLLDSGKIFTKNNIDKYILEMIDNRKHEIQVMLTNYKAMNHWYTDSEEEIRKKFEL